ncbi:MAG: AAA family ATPase [Polyangiales bacterium]
MLASLVMPREDRGVEGREAELSRVRDAMGRAQAKGALLVGAPGSGRTAVIEALASRADRAVVCLRHAALVAELRSGPPERVRALCDELAKSRGALVLALDPVAPWFSARETPEELQLELRATLQSGAAPWVGVATAEEARRLAEVEPWIERAALRVELDELTGEALASVVDARAGALSERHGVALEDGAARRALALSERYLGGRAQPDRALGVVDLALARAKREGHTTLTSGVVAAVVADVAGLPESRVAATDRERLLALEAELGRRVVGHADAIARVARVIRRNAVGFRGARPVGTFLFLGPTGVGKTETAKALAEALFPGAAPMTRFDMAEFSEPHAVSRLVGAPPGYVGYADGGQLTEAVRRRPYQLLLLDEIEKAHRDVIEALLGLLDEARLTDGRGRTADFRNTVVVMTSNLGAELYAPTPRARAIGFGPSADPTELADPARVLDAARAALPPEVWNRIDEPLVFGALARGEVAEVARRMLADSAAKLEAEQGVAVEVRDAVVDLLLASGGWEPSLGARPMRRAVARCVEAPLADAVLRGELRRGDRVSLGVADGAVRIER